MLYYIFTGGISEPLNKGQRERHGAVHLQEETSWQVHTVGVGHSGKGRCPETKIDSSAVILCSLLVLFWDTKITLRWLPHYVKTGAYMHV